MTNFNKIIRKKTEKLLIGEFISRFKQCIRKKNNPNQRFTLVLTGGSSPINLYKSLSKANINWKNIDLFWGDERFVSHRSDFSNFKLIKKYLIKKAKIDQENLFPINIFKNSFIKSTKAYEKKIKLYFKNKPVSFDLVLLGMGIDGHIASIFPGSKDLSSKKIVSPVLRKDFKRITLNLKTINNAKNIFLWLNSNKKSKAFNVIKYNKKAPVNYLKHRITKLFIIK